LVFYGKDVGIPKLRMKKRSQKMSFSFGGALEGPTILESYALQLAEDMDKAESKIRIISGECHAGLFSHELVVEAFKRAHTKGVIIDIVAGPILSALVDNGVKYSGTLDLREEGVINLYPRKRRGDECHCRIIDDKFVRVEDMHQSLEDLSLRSSKKEKLPEVITAYINRFEENIDSLQPTNNLRKDFLLLSPSEIDMVKLNYHKLYPGREFNSLKRSELAEIVNQLQPSWDRHRDTGYWVTHYEQAKVRLDKAMANANIL